MALVPALALAAAVAADDIPSPDPVEQMKLRVGRSVVLDRQAEVARISISNPDIVDAVAITTREILINAKSAGTATLVIWPKTGVRAMYAVTVERDLEPIRRLLKEAFPDEAIDVRADRDSLALVGHASNQGIADRAMALIAPLVKTVVNNLQVVPPGADKQIILRVKFAEINRNVAKSFGVNLLSTGAGNTPGRITTGQFPSGTPSSLQGQIPGTLTGATTNFSLSDVLNIFAFRPDLNLGLVIRDLQTQGVLQILAEPNLVTTNGKEASFLVGGEFPVPVVQGGQNAGAITIVFREFGIRLTFLPQVTANNTIKMHVKPEVSTIDLANGVVFSGFTIPALATRRIETDIELGEGQSFVIAGLLDDRVTENLSQVPGLSHLPILGALFKSRSETKAKTELLVIVTPESVSPLLPGDPKPLPNMLKDFLPSVAPKASSPKKASRNESPAEKPAATGGARPASVVPEAVRPNGTMPVEKAHPVAQAPGAREEPLPSEAQPIPAVPNAGSGVDAKPSPRPTDPPPNPDGYSDSPPLRPAAGGGSKAPAETPGP
ncbi:MAG TPA: pilus assembly protein N-terminal domain-containing protein [Bryobacteraceae bacterium]|nr:pilus assembly protein N-terminal domain-containing protein [Bryobacteraceae bacterium]